MGAFRIGFVVLLAYACTRETVRKVGTETVAQVGEARLERVAHETTETPGIGCEPGGGGRGSIGAPSWERSRLVARHRTEYTCRLSVYDVTIDTPCSLDPIELRVDPRGERCLVRADGEWRLFVGGHRVLGERRLEPSIAQAAAPDWSQVPTALTVAMDAYRQAASDERQIPEDARASGMWLDEVRALDPAGFASHLFELAEADRGFDFCGGDTVWLDAARQPDVRSALLAQLVPALDRTGAPAWLRDHALAVVNAKELLAHVGEPGRALETRADDVAVELLEAWSLQNATAAARWACPKLTFTMPVALRAAALLAVGRAGLACPGVAASLHGFDCVGARTAEGALFDRDAAAAEVARVAEAHIARCQPALAALLAARVQPRPPALERLCEPDADAGAAD